MAPIEHKEYGFLTPIVRERDHVTAEGVERKVRGHVAYGQATHVLTRQIMPVVRPKFDLLCDLLTGTTPGATDQYQPGNQKEVRTRAELPHMILLS